MIMHYLVTAVRHLLRRRGYTFINVAGFATGIAACFLILLYVRDELRYDVHHDRPDRIFRVTQERLGADGASAVHLALIDPAAAPLLRQAFPEIVRAARLSPIGPLLSRGDRHVQPEHFFWSDPEVFDILKLPLRAGDAGTALDDPYSVVLGRSLAERLFGEEDPLGRELLFGGELTFRVTGVFDEPPARTHLHVDALGSMATFTSLFGEHALQGWDSPNYLTYVRLADGVRAEEVERRFASLLETHLGEAAARTRLHLQPVRDIHLRSKLAAEVEPNGDIAYVRLFLAVALFILLIACINFMNLATARAAGRAREVGMRKVVGAGRGQLIAQFLGESMLTCFLALLLAVLLIELALPSFSRFTGRDLSFRIGDLGLHAAIFIGLWLAVGLLAGSYPAFVLSAFRPIAVLQGRLSGGVRGRRFRSLLVVAQFSIAVALMIGTLVVTDQLSFIRRQNLGFDPEHVVILPAIREIAGDFEPLRRRLLAHPAVVSVSQSNQYPSRPLVGVAGVEAEQGGGEPLAQAELFPVWIDAHFFPTYGIPLVAGRNLDPERAGDAAEGFILNEAAVRQLGWTQPPEAVGKRFRLGERRGEIVGVAKDFHLESLHQPIAPMAFFVRPDNYRAVSIRFRAGDVPSLIRFLEAEWARYHPNSPLAYSFLDDRFDALYRSERKLADTLGGFALLAIVITCLGLVGLAAFTAEERRREIGIRKALGASTSGIVLLLGRQFARPVLVALVVAAPVAGLAMDRWLDGFAYRIPLSPRAVLLAGAGAFLIAALSVTWQALRAARADPVRSLRAD